MRLVLLIACIALASSDKAMYGKIGMMVRLHGATGNRLGPAWERMAGAGLMAVHHVNNRNTTLVPEAQTLIPAGFRIDYELADSRSDPREGIEVALGWAQSTIHAIVGSWRSAVSGPVALVADTASLPVLSWGSTSTALSDTVSYRTFGRTVPSDAIPALGVIRMCNTFGWKKISMMFIDDPYGRGYVQDIATFAGEYGVEVATAQKYFANNEESLESALENIKTSDARIILCIAFEDDLDRIVFSADRMGIIGSGYVWVTSDGFAGPQDPVANSANPPEMARLLVGWLRISVGPFVGPLDQRFQDAFQAAPSETKMHPLLDPDPAVFDGHCSEFCGFIYDAVWALAIAIARSDTTPDRSVAGLEILGHLRGMEGFAGATGNVKFDPLTGDRDISTVPIIIKNFNAVWDEAGGLVGMTDEVKWTWSMAEGLQRAADTPPTWAGGIQTWDAPQDGSSCPPGFAFEGTRLACMPCAEGHELKEGTCVPCAVGSVAPFPGMAQCIPCSDGFAAAEGMSQCTPCPPHSQRRPNTPGESALECECSKGYYAKQGLGQGCEVCVTGGICEGGSTPPYPMEGFWGDPDCNSFQNGTKDCPFWDKFIICNPNWNCLGGKGFACEQGRLGNVCQQVEDGFFVIGGSFWNPCGKGGGGLTILYILIVVVFWFIINHFASQKYHALNIALLFVQILAIVGMFNMKWPEDLDYLNIALGVANFDVDFVSPHCLGPWSLVSSFYLQLALPWVFGILRSIFMMARQWLERRWHHQEGRHVWHSSLKQIMSFVVTMYATLAIKCFQVFRCEQYPDGRQFLWFLPEVECWKQAHIGMVVTASLYIPLVLVGTPVFIFWIIQTHQREGTLHHARVVRKWAWVHDAFEANYKYWEVMLLLRRFAIALIAGLIVEPMVQSAVAVIVLTALLAAHVFTKPYIRDDIDVMDFCSIVATIMYVLAGLLIFPNVTQKAQGRVCASDAFLRDEAEYCSREDALKSSISKMALTLVLVTVFFSFAITFRQIRSSYFSALASKIVLERCKLLGMEGEDSKDLTMETLNQVELDEIFQGTWLHAWASRIRERAGGAHSNDVLSETTIPLDLSIPEAAGSRTLVGSPEAFYRINGAIRDLDEDITEFSAKPTAVILRQLCKIPGMIEYLAWKGPDERKTLLHFVKEMAEFETMAEAEEDPFPLSQLVVEEHRPIIAYFLMTCRPSLIGKFFHLTDAILESNGHQPRTQRRVLRLEARREAQHIISGHSSPGTSLPSSPRRPPSSPFGQSFKSVGMLKKSVLGRGRDENPAANVDSMFVGRTHTSAHFASTRAGSESSFSFRERMQSQRDLNSPSLLSAGGMSPKRGVSPLHVDIPRSGSFILSGPSAAHVDLARILAWLPGANEGEEEDLKADKYVVACAKRRMPGKFIKRGGEAWGGAMALGSWGTPSNASAPTSEDPTTSLRSQQSQLTETTEDGGCTEHWLQVLSDNAGGPASAGGAMDTALEELEDIEEGEGEEGYESFNRSRSNPRNQKRLSERLSAESNKSKRKLSIDAGDLEGLILASSPYAASALPARLHVYVDSEALRAPGPSHSPAAEEEEEAAAAAAEAEALQRKGQLPIVLDVVPSPTIAHGANGTNGTGGGAKLPPWPGAALASMAPTRGPSAFASAALAADTGEMFGVKISSQLVLQEPEPNGEDKSYFGPVSPSSSLGNGQGPSAWDLQDDLASWTPDDKHIGAPAMV